MVKLIPKSTPMFKGGGSSPKSKKSSRKVDWNKVKQDPNYKKFDWRMDTKNLSVIQDSLINRNIDAPEQIAIFSQIIPENGGSTGPHGNEAFGLVGWRGSRAKNLPKTLGGQIHKLMTETYDNPSAKDWTHGGPGMGIQTGKEMYNFFKETPVVRKAVNAFMRGYVRPPESEYQKRQDFAKFLQGYIR